MTTDQGTGPSATTNQAADRLRSAAHRWPRPYDFDGALDAALSEERRLTVERIVAANEGLEVNGVDEILDEVSR